MDIQTAISERRSHRQFTGQKISQEDIKEVLEAGLLAPSPKNRQPWYFVSCGPQNKRMLLSVLKRKIEEMTLESRNPGSLPITIRSIEKCSELILVYNQYSKREPDYNKNRWKADILSIGACIQNMLLTAQSKNIQTLWICDILFAELEIRKLLGINDELIAGVVFGDGVRKKIPKRPRIELGMKLITTD